MKKLLLSAVLAFVPAVGVAQTTLPAASYQADCNYYAWADGTWTDSPVMKPQFGNVKLSGTMSAKQAYFDKTTVYGPDVLAYSPSGPSFSVVIGSKSVIFRPIFGGTFILGSAPARFDICESYLGLGKDRTGTLKGSPGKLVTVTEESSVARASFVRFQSEGSNLKTNCSGTAVQPGTPFLLNTQVSDGGVRIGLICSITLNLPPQGR